MRQPPPQPSPRAGQGPTLLCYACTVLVKMKYLRPSPPRPSGGHHQHAPTDYRPSTLHPRPTRSPPRSVPSLTGAPLREVSGYLATKRGPSRRNTRRFPVIMEHIVGIPKMPLAHPHPRLKKRSPRVYAGCFFFCSDGPLNRNPQPPHARVAHLKRKPRAGGWYKSAG